MGIVEKFAKLDAGKITKKDDILDGKASGGNNGWRNRDFFEGFFASGERKEEAESKDVGIIIFSLGKGAFEWLNIWLKIIIFVLFKILRWKTILQLLLKITSLKYLYDSKKSAHISMEWCPSDSKTMMK